MIYPTVPYLSRSIPPAAPPHTRTLRQKQPSISTPCVGGEIDSVMHPHPHFRCRCAKLTGGSKNRRREMKRRNRKPPTTASAGASAGERIQSAPSGNALLPFTGRVVATRKWGGWDSL